MGWMPLWRCRRGCLHGPNLATTSYTHRTIALDGFPVLLDGHGGDEAVYSGAAALFDLALPVRWPTLWREARAIARLDGLNPRPANAEPASQARAA